MPEGHKATLSSCGFSGLGFRVGALSIKSKDRNLRVIVYDN